MTQAIATDVLVVGAGLAGLMAARTLVEQGARVIVVDKGRSVGGRLATRRIGGGVADHGAQFFTVRDPAFGAFVERWITEGLVFEWSRGWSDGSLSVSRDGHPRYAVRGGMNALAKHLAKGLDTRLKVNLAAVKPANGGWQITDVSGSSQRAQAVLLTPPVPESLGLLNAVPLNPDDRKALEAIQYSPSLTGMFRLDRVIRLPSPGAIQRPHANVHWIADNHRKGISPGAVILTAQAGTTYSRQLWERSDEQILNALKVDLLPVIGDAQIVEAQLKRWRYSQPEQIYPERCFVAADLPAPLVFAGDAFGEPRVEGAALSGMAAGRRLIELLGNS
ncbi:MAG: FAD-dependent oxidoreductase [Anaerolineae bacterium]|nr:FAD-dependent oxidoreductase [Anaerolineae bacterium]